jgi:hypothetical protein
MYSRFCFLINFPRALPVSTLVRPLLPSLCCYIGCLCFVWVLFFFWFYFGLCSQHRLFKISTCVVIEKVLWPLLDFVIAHVFWKGIPTASAMNIFETQPDTGATVGPSNTSPCTNPYPTRKRAAMQSSEAKTTGQPAQRSPCVATEGSPTASGGKWRNWL